MTQMRKQGARGRREQCCRGLADCLDARLFRALCDPGRIAIVLRLVSLGRPAAVSEIAACCPQSLSVVSRHLAVLRDAGVVEARRKGKEVHYSPSYPALAARLRGAAEALEACCPPTTPQTRKEPHHARVDKER
jgi:ArsR family transcriptional regulator